MTEKVIESLDVIRDDLYALNNSMPQDAANILNEIVELDIGTETQFQVPFQFGQLRRSWEVEKPIITNGNVSISFGYTAAYAPYVHENTDAKHKHPTKAKFLEDPVNNAIDILEELVAEKMDRILGVV